MARPPQVSIVIPAYRSDRTIAACLSSLRAQTFRDFETIVVNSSVGDRTPAIVRGFPEVRFEQSPHRLLPQAALNRGVAGARGALLVFTAPDCIADPEWLANLVESHRDGRDVVAGSIDLHGSSRLHRGMHLSKFSWRLSGLPPSSTDLVQTANACYSRLAWSTAGPFEGDWLSGDVQLSRRAVAHGLRARFEPRARVRHRHSGGVTGFLDERLERGGDGAATRLGFERWSRRRAAAYVIAAPLLPVLLLARAGRDATRAGWTRTFLETLPLQLAGHTAWALGEARAHLRFLRRAPSGRSVPGR
jgi:GT2 family glycosyltransferase